MLTHKTDRSPTDRTIRIPGILVSTAWPSTVQNASSLPWPGWGLWSDGAA